MVDISARSFNNRRCLAHVTSMPLEYKSLDSEMASEIGDIKSTFANLLMTHRLYPRTSQDLRSRELRINRGSAESSYTCPKSSFIIPSRRQHGFLHCMSVFRLPEHGPDGFQCAIFKAKEGKIDEIHSRTSPFNSDYLS